MGRDHHLSTRSAVNLSPLAGGFVLLAKRRPLASALSTQLLDLALQSKQLLLARTVPAILVLFNSRRVHISYTTQMALAL
jgi:hypothetical protein